MISKKALSRWSLALVLGLLLVIFQVTSVFAGGRDRLRWTPGCEGFTSQGGGIILNRDNTGQGREAFSITGYDGAGNVIFGPVTDSSFVGAGIYILAGVSFDWQAAPVSNPLTVEVVSLAGNGLNEQLIYAALGACDGLVYAGDEAATEDLIPSQSVPLNATAPRLVNPDNLGLTEDGYLVVTNIGTVNLRSGDGVEYTIVGQVVHAEQLYVLGRNEDRSWWFVRAGEVRGWINGTLVAVRGDVSRVPLVETAGELLPPRLFLFIDQPIYTGANGLELCVVPGNQEYEITGRNLGGSWYQIRANCGGAEVLGWIAAENGAFRNAGLPIPVVN